jgi:hypothetical protein
MRQTMLNIYQYNSCIDSSHPQRLGILGRPIAAPVGSQPSIRFYCSPCLFFLYQNSYPKRQ